MEAAWRAVEPEDLTTLIYTSGTTGPPKGVQLVHRNLIAAVKATEALIRFPDGSKVISWLPSAHMAERMAHHYLPIAYAMTITCCPNPREVVGYLPAVKPTWFFAVPRIWEKLKAGMEAHLSADAREAGVAGGGGAEGRARAGGRGGAGGSRGDRRRGRRAAVRAACGRCWDWTRRCSVNVGAAPTPREVIVFFHSIGVPLAELWGMSETCGAGCCNPPDLIKIGSVGPAAPGVELRLAEDGELLMRSQVVMTGYRNLPDRTAEALDADGWLHTGDIAKIDDDGYVTIVDRKKELIISAGGKNMSPANIEATLKGASPLIGQVCVIGDGRPYNTALIVLDADFGPAFAAQKGIEGGDLASLARSDAMRAAVQAGVDDANSRLSRVEQIKKFTLRRGRLGARAGTS